MCHMANGTDRRGMVSAAGRVDPTPLPFPPLPEPVGWRPAEGSHTRHYGILKENENKF